MLVEGRGGRTRLLPSTAFTFFVVLVVGMGGMGDSVCAWP